MSDPYKNFRDSRGRFIKGNPGRQIKTFTWLSEKAFKKKYKFLNIEKPSSCPNCGENKYRFNIRFDGVKLYSIRCKCNNCNNPRTYSFSSCTWSSI